jgi:indolepyruvate ferredoxin oxidoreductase beta subunit
MLEEFNIVLAGVGGQGTLLAAEILGTAAVKDGLNVRVSEIHGMAQRGGSVTSNVRIGENVASPTVMDGEADVLLGFEPIETLRAVRCASENTLVLMSDEKVFPPELATRNLPYPDVEWILGKVGLFSKRIVVVETEKLAREAGSFLTRNSVLLGVLAGSGELPIKGESVIEALRGLVPGKHVEMNVRAYWLGCDFVKRKIGSV